VEEYLPSNCIRTGENEIFFNRNAERNYLYKIKNLRIGIKKKQIEDIKINSQKINYGGFLYIQGFTKNKDINELEILGEKIKVVNGIFEKNFKNISKDLNSFDISYNNEIIKTLNILYENRVPTHVNESTNYENAPITLNSSGIVSLKSIKIEGIFKPIENINLEGLEFKELKPLNSDVVNVTSGNYLGYRLNEKTQNDSIPFKIHLKYDSNKIPDGYTNKDVRIFSFDKNKREWIPLPVDSLNFAAQTVISNSKGETDYINGVIKVPEMAETSSFAPTTITDMKYANPSAGVVSIPPPTPNNNGNVSTSFPIKLPNGRNGMSPSLAVNYNSEGGNGWMGHGWNLQLPSITIDTRWGVPKFDLTNETEIYQLNGQTLVQKVGNEYTNPHRHHSDITRNTSGSKTFYFRKEGGYSKIVRLGTTPSTYRWVITDKFGNRNFYGTTTNAKIFDNSLSNGNVTQWLLNKTDDPAGNYVTYEYDRDNVDTQETNGVNAQFFYPKKIKYTLKNGYNSNYYQIDFKRKNYSVGSSGSVI
jgi:hypothetical protein